MNPPVPGAVGIADLMRAPDELDGLVEQARTGDARAFALLFETFGTQVAGYLRARAVADPDGTANEVFLRVFRTVHTFRGDGSRFRAWLFTIAHHAAVDDARRRRRRARETTVENVPDAAGGDAETHVMARLADERARAMLDRLSPDQRDVVLLRVVSGLSVKEVAEVLDKGEEAVKALQRRGLAALRRALVDPEGVPK
jgi:RNA polymerase sigma factor (sigma-70 family)